MGYYTGYSLKVLKKDGSPLSGAQAIIAKLREPKPRETYCEPAEAFNSDGSFSGETLKWYSHETDLKVFSVRFPNVLFLLEGNGEDSTDMWAKYFLDGKMQTEKASITFGKFDPKKLNS